MQALKRKTVWTSTAVSFLRHAEIFPHCVLHPLQNPIGCIHANGKKKHVAQMDDHLIYLDRFSVRLPKTCNCVNKIEIKKQYLPGCHVGAKYPQNNAVSADERLRKVLKKKENVINLLVSFPTSKTPRAL